MILIGIVQLVIGSCLLYSASSFSVRGTSLRFTSSSNLHSNKLSDVDSENRSVSNMLRLGDAESSCGELSRRSAIRRTTSAFTGALMTVYTPHATLQQATAAATTNTAPRTVKSSTTQLPRTGKVSIQIPRVGYSLYKTDRQQVAQCVRLALHANIKHFDVGTLYNTNSIVGDVLHDYFMNGLPTIDTKGYLVEENGVGEGDNIEMERRRSRSFQRRRSSIFISHKLSNDQQSASTSQVQQAIYDDIKKLRVDYLDLCMIHSPLTDKDRRLGTYKALVESKEKGLIKSIGVCNYGINALEEIVNAGYPAPDVIQLQLSPFNQHNDIAAWAATHGSVLSCAAWSKLSSAQGPQEGWSVVGDIAKKYEITKAQVLILWSLQHNYLCVPRSAASSKLERLAIAENSFDGVKDYKLTQEEMNTLDSLDEGLKSGRLGVKDGWNDNDILSSDWDPTEFV